MTAWVRRTDAVGWPISTSTERRTPGVTRGCRCAALPHVQRDFVGRGICAGYTDNAFTIADDLRLPRWTGRKWEPFNPADWQAYAPRQRWFRTPNDAFMTGNFHVSESLMQKVLKLQGFSSFQLLLASIYSGAFHPTAEGQAAIADAVVAEARRVLAKYAAQ